ncbi:hypothetical protein OH802_14760 [Nocardioides sp. NBC_00850]|uniref:hypothetical protein n=1 Tax=Nocardioides sp. NBC_00850 TaxID=2976001 RepID=UPI00386445BB|nr:hypothetical protein OH802_14760 [Nocardioides sp. NBC_00850]
MSTDVVVDRLARIRQGRGLAEPTAVLGLAETLKQTVARANGKSPTARPEDEVRIGVDLIRATLLLMPDDLRQVATAQFNLSSRDLGRTLSDREEDLARDLKCSAKTIRRRGAEAVALMAHFIRSGEAEARLLEGRLMPEENSIQAPHDPPTDLRTFWGWPQALRIDILCSEIPESERPYFAHPSDRNYLRYAKFADLDTLIYLRSQLARYLPESNIRDFSPSEYYDSQADELIVIGGPPWNSKYRELQHALPLGFQANPLGQDDPLIDGDALHYPEWLPDGTLQSDISLFSRITLRSGQQIKMLGGCLTAGVLGAARCFLDQAIAGPNIRWVIDQVGTADFSLAFRTPRLGSFLDPPLLAEAGLRILYAKQPGAASFDKLTL